VVMVFNSFLGCDRNRYSWWYLVKSLSIPFWDATITQEVNPETGRQTFNSFLGCDVPGFCFSGTKWITFQFLSGMRQL